MNKILIANGCSFTAGQDLDPNNINQCGEKAWPRWVADHFKYNWVNMAVGSSGNEQISRSTILVISNLIELDKFNPEDIVVCILWSGFARHEYWCEDNGCHRSLSLSSKVFGKFSYKIRKYIEACSLMQPDNYSNYKNLYYIYTLAKFLESYKIKYYFGNAIRPFIKPEQFSGHPNLVNEYKNLVHLYGSRKETHLGFYENEHTYKHILKDFPNTADGVHWDVTGHIEYANRFIKHMQEVDGRVGN